MWIEEYREVNHLIVDCASGGNLVQSLLSVESLFGDFASGWVRTNHPRGVTAEAIMRTERRGSWRVAHWKFL